MTAIVEFILALITTLSSKPIHFFVNRQKLKVAFDAACENAKMIDFSPNLQFKASRNHFLYLSSIA